MYDILTINKIAEKGLDRFRDEKIDFADDKKDYDAIIL